LLKAGHFWRKNLKKQPDQDPIWLIAAQLLSNLYATPSSPNHVAEWAFNCFWHVCGRAVPS
jgi:hypothetical protein